jgi:hypothetical protein
MLQTNIKKEGFTQGPATKLLKFSTPIYILTTLEYKLSQTLAIPHGHKYAVSEYISTDTKMTLLIAIQHLNILEWDMFLKGFTSTLWEEIYYIDAHRSGWHHAPLPRWGEKKAKLVMTLYYTRAYGMTGIK